MPPFIHPGLFIAGDYNVVSRNRIIGNTIGIPTGEGIVVNGTKNVLGRHTVLENVTFDLRDVKGDSAHNTWQFNTSVTASPACIQ